jgi:purine catabolism regulator
MLTVAEALKLDVLAGARVVAGRGGLNRVVGWVHNAGVPDAPDWLNGGELVLTTAINMPSEPEAQRDYVRAMAEKGVAALCIAVGRYIDAIPDYLREAADECDFPLIEIPYQLRFVDIAKVVNAQVMQENMAMVSRALNIHQALTQLVLEGGDFQQLARRLAELIKQSVSIETDRFEALASENIAAVDEARRYTLLHGRTDPRLVRALDERGVLPEIRKTLRPIFIPQMPDVGLEMERILAPIVVHGEIYGYVWIIADDRPLSDLDRMAIESGATIAALMMLHQEAIQSAEASLKGSLLTRLIEGDDEALKARDTVLTDQALRYGVDLRLPYALLLIESADTSSQRLVQLYRRVNRLATDHQWAVVVGHFAGQVAVLAQADSREKADAIAATIHSESNGHPTRIGVSAIQRGAECVGSAYQQCRETLLITRRMHHDANTLYFDDLGYLHTLYQAGADSLASNPYVPGLRSLLGEERADLFHTLETYLDAGGNGIQTADLLHIYRSTLNYRLARIEELCSFKLSDPTTRTNLQVAVKLLRLFEVE